MLKRYILLFLNVVDMKKLSYLVLLFSTFLGFAQNNFNKENLHNSFISKNEVSLKINEFETFYVIKQEKVLGDAVTYYGNVGAYSPSIISITFKNNEVSGEIIIPELDKTWAISSGKNGGIVFVEENEEDHVCVQKDDHDHDHDPQIHHKTKETKVGIPIPEGVDISMLESYPESDNVVYIDTDGELVSGTYWNTFYNQDNDLTLTPAGITDEEIYEIWKIMTEDYAAFDINITTRRDVYDNTPFNKSVMLIITPYSSWYKHVATGVGKFWSFKNDDAPCFAFPSGFADSPTRGTSLGEVGSHEVGHALGLKHDGGNTGTYYGGHGDWAPLMGNGFYRNITQFSKGEYNGADNTEDDLFVITQTSGVSYKTDDHSNDESDATPLLNVGDSILEKSNNGIVEQSTDVDFFSFKTGGGLIDLMFNGASPKPNLNIKATLYDSNLQEVSSSEVPGEVYAQLNVTLPSGLYYIKVEGVGEGSSASTGYSDYATLGYFGISGTIANFQTTSNVPQIAFISPTKNEIIEMNPLSAMILKANVFDTDGTITSVVFKIGGQNLIAQKQGLYYEASWTPTAFGEYDFEVEAVDNDGKISNKSIEFTLQVSPTVHDVKLKSVLGAGESTCGTLLSPIVVVENRGSSLLNSYVLEVYLDNVLISSSSQSTSLNKGGTETIQLSTIDLGTGGNHDLKFLVKNPNNTTDENLTDNENQISTNVIVGAIHELVVDKRSASDDLSFEVKDGVSTVVSSSDASIEEVGDELIYSFCLSSGCYVLEVEDAFILGECTAEEWNPSITYPTGGTEVSYNGFKYKNKWYANIGDEPGVNNVWEFVGECVKTHYTDQYSLREQGSVSYFEVQVQGFTSPKIDNLCYDGILTAMSYTEDENVLIYPNPVNDDVNVLAQGLEEVQVIDATGQVLEVYASNSSKLEVNISDLPSGVYVLKISLSDKVILKRIYKN